MGQKEKRDKIMKEWEEVQRQTMELDMKRNQLMIEGRNDKLIFELTNKIDGLLAKQEKLGRKFSDNI